MQATAHSINKFFSEKKSEAYISTEIKIESATKGNTCYS
jgi:hypothetical protein